MIMELIRWKVKEMSWKKQCMQMRKEVKGKEKIALAFLRLDVFKGKVLEM